MAKKTNLSINIKNRKAEYEYFLLTTYTAGIVLSGTEIKSIRAGKANLTDSYCSFINNELWVHNMHISEYANGSYNNHEPKRDRKLLLNRKELNKIERTLQDKGITAVGLKIFINERGLAKLLVGVARGKKQYDKRETLKEKDAKREMERFTKR